jgi:hypothetical protein
MALGANPLAAPISAAAFGQRRAVKRPRGGAIPGLHLEARFNLKDEKSPA